MFDPKGCADYLPTILLFVLISCVTNQIGYKKKFYTLPLNPEKTSLSLLQVLGCFAIYFIAFLPLAHFLFKAGLIHLPSYEQTSVFALSQILTTFLCFFFFGRFLLFLRKRICESFGKTLLTSLSSL